MKKIFVYFNLILLIASCSSKKIFLNQLPDNQIASVSFSEPTISVCFFGEKNESESYLKHQIAEKDVSNYFGSVTSDFPVFNIGTENYVSYKNEKGLFVFFKENLNEKYGIIISNGIDMPIVVTNPEKYLSKIKSYLKKDNTDLINEQAKLVVVEKDFELFVKNIVQNKINPDNIYADALIKNANNVRGGYPYIPKFEVNNKCRFKKQTSFSFEDQKMTKKMPYSDSTIFDQNYQLLELISYDNGKITLSSSYSRLNNNLIDKITTNNRGEINTNTFNYYSDKYYVINYLQGIANSYDVYFLNDKKQCIRHLTYNDEQTVSTEETFVFDEIGRVIEENNLNNKLIYKFADLKSLAFNEFKIFESKSNKIVGNYILTQDKNVETYLAKDANGKQTFKTISTTSNDCKTIKSKNFDSENKFSSASLIKYE